MGFAILASIIALGIGAVIFAVDVCIIFELLKKFGNFRASRIAAFTVLICAAAGSAYACGQLVPTILSVVYSMPLVRTLFLLKKPTQNHAYCVALVLTSFPSALIMFLYIINFGFRR